ncbi:MAG: hydrogenase expression/formation protein HypE, partial [Schwartzia sp.]|nr:hydrogenase expression/formation protein HypE [Schwartzia sp. (in: firmicutes)]
MTDTIQLAHGAGGRMSARLMDEVVRPILGNPVLDRMHDGAVLDTGGKIAFTTDSYVVAPRFFPGGSIGRLAVCGTVNDLAVSGAEAKYLSLALILEEGLAVGELVRVLKDVRTAADEAGVSVVTGDTKVVGHGSCDGIYINTAGIGEMMAGADIAPRNIRPGMEVIVSGFLGDHAATITAARHGLKLPETIQSDAAPLNGLVREMLRAVPEIACLRDPTRGGAAATLNELAAQSGTGVLLDEEAIPVRPEVESVCELLGFEPLYLANEGKLIAFVPAEKTEALLGAMRAHPYGKEARRVGVVTDKAPGQVAMKTGLGGIR